jgi:threonine/homoserine/homoserine lactone efflux protein
MSLHAFLLFLPACFALNMAFGPNNLLSLTNGARVGVAPAVLASTGRLAAFAIMIAIAGLGLGALLMASEAVFTAVKWAGAAYLVWLGVKLFRSGTPVVAADGNGQPARPLASLAREEFLVAAGNPKAILIFTAFFPQFVDPAAYASSFAILGTTFLVLEVVAITAYSLAGARLRSLMRGTAFRWFNRVSGGTMVVFGLMLAVTRRPAI